MTIFIDACCGSSGGGYDYSAQILTSITTTKKVVVFFEDQRLLDLVELSLKNKRCNIVLKLRSKAFNMAGFEDFWRIVILPVWVKLYKTSIFVSIAGVVSPFIFVPKKISIIHNILYFQSASNYSWTLVDRSIFLYKRLMLTVSMKIADRVITFSEDAKKALSNGIGNEKIVVVLHSSKFFKRRKIFVNVLTDPLNHLNIFINSSCMPHKNLKTSIAGVILFSGLVGCRITLQVAGNLNNRRYTKTLLDWYNRLNVSAAVETLFLGYLDDNSLAKVSEEAHICIAPSLIEIFDIGCLDSLLMCGRVCVSDTGVHRELFHSLRGVYFFEGTNEWSLALTLKRSLNSSAGDYAEIESRFPTWREAASRNWSLIDG